MRSEEHIENCFRRINKCNPIIPMGIYLKYDLFVFGVRKKELGQVIFNEFKSIFLWICRKLS